MLTSLPNEILQEIALHVLPADLESFAQTCRHIASVMDPYLPNHRRMIRRYAVYDADDEDLDQPTGTTFIGQLAQKVAANPTIGHYIRHLKSNSDHILDGRLAREEQFSALTALLCLLPNLNALSIDESHNDLERLQDTFASSGIIQAALPQLKRFRVRSSGYQGVPLAFVQAFSVLPSMKELNIENSGDVDDEGFTAPVKCQVTHLELLHCQIRAEELNEFLRGFPLLETLIYAGNRGSSDRDNINVGYAIPAGLECASRSLKKLVWIAPGKPKCFMGDLRAFEFLEELETELEFLRASIADSRPTFQLPTSLKSLKVTLSVDSPEREYTELVEATTRWKSTCGHCLQKVQLWETDGWGNSIRRADDKPFLMLFQGLREDCSAVGISLKLEGTDDRGYFLGENVS